MINSKSFHIAGFICSAFLMLACQTDPKVEIEKEILQLETTVDYDSAAPLLEQLYEKQLDYLEPLDTLWDVTMWKKAQVERQQGKYDQAIETMLLIFKKGSDLSVKQNALFMAAFLADEEMNDDARAEKLYILFLDEYPDARQAEQVRTLMNYLGKTNEEVLQELLEKNK